MSIEQKICEVYRAYVIECHHTVHRHLSIPFQEPSFDQNMVMFMISSLDYMIVNSHYGDNYLTPSAQQCHKSIRALLDASSSLERSTSPYKFIREYKLQKDST